MFSKIMNHKDTLYKARYNRLLVTPLFAHKFSSEFLRTLSDSFAADARR